jgi:hypothetical protein
MRCCVYVLHYAPAEGAAANKATAGIRIVLNGRVLSLPNCHGLGKGTSVCSIEAFYAATGTLTTALAQCYITLQLTRSDSTCISVLRRAPLVEAHSALHACTTCSSEIAHCVRLRNAAVLALHTLMCSLYNSLCSSSSAGVR